MTFTRITGALFALALAGLSAAPALAEEHTEVHVSMWDKGDTSMDMLGEAAPMGMAMSGVDNMSNATMGFTLDKSEVKAGEITFVATNDSTTLVHEMIVAPVADTSKQLPYNNDENAVDEEAAGAIGEVPEMDPGKSGQLTLHLDPGTYILFCNIPGHYVMGMWTLLTVTQ